MATIEAQYDLLKKANEEAFNNALEKLLEFANGNTEDQGQLTPQAQKLVLDAVKYQGWDARVWCRMTLSLIMSLPEKYDVGGQNIDPKDDYVAIFQLLIILFINRGNKFDLIMSRTPSGKIKLLYQALQSKLKIQSSINRASLGSPYAITLARVCSALPNFTIECMIVLKNQRLLITPVQMGVDDMEECAATAICSGFIHSMWPQEYLKEGAALISLYHSLLLDRLINRVASKRSSLGTLWGFHKIGITADNINNDERVKAMDRWKVKKDSIAKLAEQTQKKFLEAGFSKEDMKEILDECKELQIAQAREPKEIVALSEEALAIWFKHFEKKSAN